MYNIYWANNFDIQKNKLVKVDAMWFTQIITVLLIEFKCACVFRANDLITRIHSGLIQKLRWNLQRIEAVYLLYVSMKCAHCQQTQLWCAAGKCQI